MTAAAAARQRALARLDAETFDLLVVGGGATGAGVARDAALRGLQVALCDHGDFAGETSGASSKLIHGGLRYVQYGDLRLIFEALAERRRLMRIAPHLCRPVEFLFPSYRGTSPGRYTLGAGIAIYNALALWRAPAGGRRLDTAEVSALSPAMRTAGLTGAHLYVDCQTDDARLVLETVLDAEAAGAAVAPRVTVTGLIHDRRGRIIGARARDRLSDAPLVVRARAVVNATGPFSDAFDRGRRNLRPTLGVHLVLDASRLPHGGRATVLRSPRDGRLVFLLPAGPRTFLGTTDTDWAPPGEAPRAPRPGDAVEARASDVAYLLEVARHAFPSLDLQPDDVISTFAGLRPLVAVDARTPSSTSREHELLVERDGLLTIVGGKLTTYRRMAEEVVDRAIELLRNRGYERKVAPCSTSRRPLPGGGAEPGGSLGPVELARDIEDHLRSTYGARAPAVVALMLDGSPHANLGGRIDPDLPYVWAEIVHAAHHELVTEVEDLLRRRIPLFRDGRDQGLAAAARAAALLGDAHGWSAGRRGQSVDQYRQAVARSRAWRAITTAAETAS